MSPTQPQADRLIASTSKERLRVILAIAIVIVGITHFVVPEPYIKIVPDYLPYHRELVYIS
jgi:uncharacterized membrane protein